LVRDYRYNVKHANFYDRKEENWYGSPFYTKAGKNIPIPAYKYEQDLKSAQYEAMKEYRRIISDPALYKRKRPRRQVKLLPMWVSYI
jgi:hypothetical protein